MTASPDFFFFHLKLRSRSLHLARACVDLRKLLLHDLLLFLDRSDFRRLDAFFSLGHVVSQKFNVSQVVVVGFVPASFPLLHNLHHARLLFHSTTTALLVERLACCRGRFYFRSHLKLAVLSHQPGPLNRQRRVLRSHHFRAQLKRPGAHRAQI